MLASQGLPSLEEGLTKLCLGLGYDMLASHGVPSLEKGLTKLCLGLGYGILASQGLPSFEEGLTKLWKSNIIFINISVILWWSVVTFSRCQFNYYIIVVMVTPK
jgi:hypothetical protein